MALMGQKITENKFFLLLTSFYFIFRLTNLTLLPIFNDEAIYLDWGWKSLNIPGQFFLSLADAKQPLVMWLFGIAQMFPFDPLFAGRLVSVLFGFSTFLGIYKLAKRFFSESIALLSIATYIVIPIFSFYDRQALMESAVSACGVWSCYLFLRFWQTKRVFHSALLGIILGLGFISKTNVLVFVFAVAVYSVTIFFLEKSKKFFFGIFRAGSIAIGISFISWSQALFWQTLASNSRYSLTFWELTQLPFATWLQTSKGILIIAFWQITPVVFILSIVGIYAICRRGNRDRKFIASWFLVTLFFAILFTRNVQPRYLVSFLPLMSIFFSYALVTFWKYQKVGAFVILFFSALLPLYLIMLQLFVPLRYFSFLQQVSAFSQKSEYVTDWPSGYGVSEIITTLQDLSGGKKMYVGVRPDAGNPESSMYAYFNNSRSIRPTYVNSAILYSYIAGTCIKSMLPFYFVVRDTQLAGLEQFLEKKILRVYKPEGKSYITLYQLRRCGVQ